MVKVSVVVPIYNVKQYIDECITSLINQSLNEIDIILVDDGSTDGSQMICDKYAEKFDTVRVIHKKNGGLGSARNVGLNAAKGKYVYFIDGDDSIKIGALEKLYILAEKNALDVILFSAECFSECLGINYNPNQYMRTKCLDKVLSGKELFIKLVDANEYYASIPMRFYRTEYLQRKEYRFPEDIIHEDEIYAYWSLIQSDKALCISNRFYNRRFRAGSIMTSKKAYCSCIGYIYTWKQMIFSIDELNDWKKTEIEKAIKVADDRLGIVARLYAYSLDRSERQQIDKQLIKIKEIAEKQKIQIRSKALSIFLISPQLYRFLIRIYNIRSFMKRIIVDLEEKYALLKALLKLKYTHAIKKTSAILIGTPTHGNLGDQAIVLAEKKMLSETKYKRSVVEICSKNYLKYADAIQRMVLPSDIIIIDGGGSMGTLWVNNEYRFRDVISRFPQNKIYIFPQTIYYGKEIWEQKILQESKQLYSKHPKLTIFCRDLNSFYFAKKQFLSNEIIYTPDMVLSFYPQKYDLERRKKILLCSRGDIEASDAAIKSEVLNLAEKLNLKIESTSTLTGGYINNINRKREIINKWKEFASVKLVITDRLHAMIFCALTGTPCIAIDNLSKKVSGSYAWITDLPYIAFVRDKRDIIGLNIDNLLSKTDNFEELKLLEEKFKELKDIISNV